MNSSEKTNVTYSEQPTEFTAASKFEVFQVINNGISKSMFYAYVKNIATGIRPFSVRLFILCLMVKIYIMTSK